MNTFDDCQSEPFINIKLVAIFITNIVDRCTSTHIIVEI